VVALHLSGKNARGNVSGPYLHAVVSRRAMTTQELISAVPESVRTRVLNAVGMFSRDTRAPRQEVTPSPREVHPASALAT
jgi:hypothetical protein